MTQVSEKVISCISTNKSGHDNKFDSIRICTQLLSRQEHIWWSHSTCMYVCRCKQTTLTMVRVRTPSCDSQLCLQPDRHMYHLPYIGWPSMQTIYCFRSGCDISFTNPMESTVYWWNQDYVSWIFLCGSSLCDFMYNFFAWSLLKGMCIINVLSTISIDVVVMLHYNCFFIKAKTVYFFCYDNLFTMTYISNDKL